jgi:hypothetical protein
MYEMMKIRGKPPLHGGAAFGVAWKELMPSLKNAWNSEAYNEDLRANRKVYEKSAAALAAADESEPVPPLRLRAVLLDISSRINTLLGSVTSATSEIDTNMNNGDPAEVNLSAISTEWNDLVAYLNPLVIGPVNVGMNDEDTNQLHSLVTNQLLQPLMMLQEKAYSYIRGGGPIINSEVILSDDIARNIMLQVKDKYYKAVPYGEERRGGPGMRPRPYGVNEDDDDDDEDELPGESEFQTLPPSFEEGVARVEDLAQQLARIGEEAYAEEMDRAAKVLQRAGMRYLESRRKKNDERQLVAVMARTGDSIERARESGSRARQVVEKSFDDWDDWISDAVKDLSAAAVDMPSSPQLSRESAQVQSPRQRPQFESVRPQTPGPNAPELPGFEGRLRRAAAQDPPNSVSMSPGQRPDGTPSWAIRLPLSTSPPTRPQEVAFRRSERDRVPAVSKAAAATASMDRREAEAVEAKGFQAWKKRLQKLMALSNPTREERSERQSLREQGATKGWIIGKGKHQGKGRWTDYSGPMPSSTPRSMGSGVAGAKRPRKIKSDNDPLYFHDDDNDVCETGESSRPDEMINTEIREAHLDPDWKGLPKRWGQERRYKKLRKGYGMPKENY